MDLVNVSGVVMHTKCGDGSASVGLTPEQEALCKAMLKRTQSDPQGDPLTGAELGAGKQNTSSSAK